MKMRVEASLAIVAVLGAAPAAWAQDPLPPFQTLRLKIRDFTPDHPDFDLRPGDGYGHHCGNIETELGEDGKPVFTGEGYRVLQQWRDAQSREIAWCVFDESIDRVEGKGKEGEPDSGGITSAETFDQWYRDIPGVNLSRVVPVRAELRTGGMYWYVDTGFHPIDDALLGDDTNHHNLYFTVELVADFKYRAADHQVLEFKGDDDLWVFIDGRLVIDLGGCVSNQDQFIELDRLGLEDGRIYRLHLFQAERQQPKSQFRLVTNILFERDDNPITVTEQFD